jgi:hypothetical protein
MAPEFQQRMLAAFPDATWGSLVRGVREGITLADDVIRNTPMLATLLGRDLKGQIRRVGVLYRLQQLCASGELPFAAEATKMPVGSWHWLDIRSGSVLAHVVRTETADALPQDTTNRQTKYVKNQYDLYEDGKIVPISRVIAEAKEFYCFLTFGTDRKGGLTHASLGMPSSENDEWLAFAKLERRAQAGTAAPADAATAPNPRDKIRFREHVQEMLADKQNEADDERSA